MNQDLLTLPECFHDQRKDEETKVHGIKIGCAVQKWSNVSNKHVTQVAARWQEKGLTPGTIKNYLTAVRDLCKAFSNERIHTGNDAFGVARRVYVSHKDKAASQEVCALTEDLWQSRLAQGQMRPLTVSGYMTHLRAIRRDFAGRMVFTLTREELLAYRPVSPSYYWRATSRPSLPPRNERMGTFPNTFV